jgi:hypothetical protein
MLTPAKTDPNREVELVRREKEPETFGMQHWVDALPVKKPEATPPLGLGKK